MRVCVCVWHVCVCAWAVCAYIYNIYIYAYTFKQLSWYVGFWDWWVGKMIRKHLKLYNTQFSLHPTAGTSLCVRISHRIFWTSWLCQKINKNKPSNAQYDPTASRISQPSPQPASLQALTFISTHPSGVNCTRLLGDGQLIAEFTGISCDNQSQPLAIGAPMVH